MDVRVLEITKEEVSNGSPERKTSTRMAAKHLAKPVRYRAGHAPTFISSEGEFVSKLRRPERETKTKAQGRAVNNGLPGF